MSIESSANNAPTGLRLKCILRSQKARINGIAWSPEDWMIASTSYDNSVCLWNTETGKLHHTLRGHLNATLNVAWSLDGRHIASTSYDKSIRIWSVEGGESQRLLIGRKDLLSSRRIDQIKPEDLIRITRVVWSPDGELLASDFGTDVQLWNSQTWEQGRLVKGQSGPIICLAWSPDGDMLAAGSLTGTIRVWDTKTWELLWEMGKHKDAVRTLAWSPDCKTLASGGEDMTIQLWDSQNGKQTRVLEGHTKRISCLSFSSDGSFLASKAGDHTVRLWRCDIWENISIIPESTYDFGTASVAFHPTLPVLATLGADDTIVRIWEIDFSIILGIKPVVKSVHYTTAKIALVGDSGVGKTGLGWRLSHGEFKEHSSTHGQQFWIVNELGTTRTDGTECEAVLWDLAGQPDYRLVHALFLDDVDLALVLFDPANRQEPLKGVEYWLKLLEGRKGQLCRTILVGARLDRGFPTLTNDELQSLCDHYCITGNYIGTSALNGQGIPELMGRIKKEIPWDDMTATVTTETFKRIKMYVLSLKELTEREGILVSPTELRERLQMTDPMWEFSDAEMMTAVKHLENHGYVTILRGSTGEITVLLAPDLLTNLASSFVLEARRNPRGLGVLEENRILRGEYSFPEIEDLSERERDILLDATTGLFLEHNICFRETLGNNTFLVFPALINQRRPLLQDIETTDGGSYVVTGAVENLYAALVVLLGYTSTFTRTNHWQNQAQYEMGPGEICGFRQIQEREREIELTLYYGVETPEPTRMLFQALIERFLKGRNVRMMKYPPVVCPQCSFRQERNIVIKLMAQGREILFCSNCGEKIMLPKEGEEVILNRRDHDRLEREHTLAQMRTVFETALVRIKAIVRNQDRLAPSPSCFISYAWGRPDQERWVSKLATDLQNAGINVFLDQWSNPNVGADIARFISLIESANFIVVVGTPHYRQKYENKASETGSVVAAEVNLIHLRLIGANNEAETVLPLLLDGDNRTSLPPLLQGRVIADFRKEEFYFSSLFSLILTIYCVPFNYPGLSDLQDSMRGYTLKDRYD
jgi:small GTP-binding protein